MTELSTEKSRSDLVVNQSVEDWPRISIITAVYNGERYLEATIRSVLSQGYPNLEYIVVNGGSTDSTPEILDKFEPRLACRIDQPNQGMYAALNAGFACSSGEIMGWLNSSDMFHTHCLYSVAEMFRSFPEVRWVTGRPVLFGDAGWPATPKPIRRWSRYRFLAGANKHIQQESTFWRRNLWDEAGGALSTEYRAEGDFELWVRFFRHAKLHTADVLLGEWRFHVDALSHSNPGRYDRNCDGIIDRELQSMIQKGESPLFCKFVSFARRTRFVRGAWNRLVVPSLYKWKASDWPPLVTFKKDKWEMVP